jgi:hypothetical protein
MGVVCFCNFSFILFDLFLFSKQHTSITGYFNTYSLHSSDYIFDNNSVFSKAFI